EHSPASATLCSLFSFPFGRNGMPVRSSLRIVSSTVFAAIAVGSLCSFPRAAQGQPKEKTGAEASWAYRTPTRPALPAVRNRNGVRNPIDAFIRAKLEEA